MSSELQWTPNKPTESGWYWIYVFDWRGDKYVDCAFYSADRNEFEISVDGYEWEPDYTVADVRQWLGPITPPEPPAEVGNGN